MGRGAINNMVWKFAWILSTWRVIEDKDPHLEPGLGGHLRCFQQTLQTGRLTGSLSVDNEDGQDLYFGCITRGWRYLDVHFA